MKSWKALYVVAIILAIIAIFMMYQSVISKHDTNTVTIPSGSGWYYSYEFYLPSGSNVSVEYLETLGRSVDVSLFTSSQFDRYSNGLQTESLYSESGASGEFSHTAANSDTYYLIFEHGSGFSSSSQSVTVDFRVNGLDTLVLVVGLVLLIIGAILGFAAYRMKKEDKPPWAHEMPKDSDVVMFDRQE